MKTNTQTIWPFPTGPNPSAHVSNTDSAVDFPEPTLNSARRVFEAAIKSHRQELIDKAKVLGVGLVHIFDVDLPKGGLTVAFRKVSPHKSGTMVEVAVATCSDKDTFSRKIGATVALQKFYNGETIELPLLRSCTERDLNEVVKHAFIALNFSM